MEFAAAAAASLEVAATAARTAKVATLAALLRAAGEAERLPLLAWLIGEVRQGKLGIGPAALRAVPEPAVQSSLTIAAVDRALEGIAALRGKGAPAARAAALAELQQRMTAIEQDFFRRLVGGELRQGALAGLVLEAAAVAAAVPPAALRRAAMLAGDLPTAAAAALAAGSDGLTMFRLRLLQPVQPMLAQTVDAAATALDELGEAALEWKLDGARIQVHRAGDQVRVFSRQLHDVTAAVPEIVELVAGLPVDRLILDGEAIALQDDGRPQPFQVTMRRFGRKLRVAEARRELPLAAFFFDALHADGDDLLDRPERERALVLAGLLPADLRVARLVTADPGEAAAFLDRALATGHEGLMIKDLAAAYAAGRRGAAWRKLKPVHTFDLVVLAAEWGSGRRRGRLSNLHLGARDEAAGSWVMLGKTFKGMTDALLAWQTAALLERAIGRDGHVVRVRPELVVEVACDGVQRSPQYPGGVALRFARVRRYRPDKPAAEATTIGELRSLLPAHG